MHVQALGWTVRGCVALWTIPTCREYSVYFTENFAAGTGYFNVTDMINSWMDEAVDYDPEDPQPSHFTQVVWKSTTYVGCAIVVCPPGSIFPEVYGVRILPPNFIP